MHGCGASSARPTGHRHVEENMNHQNDGTELELESANGVFEMEMEQISEKETECRESD